MTSPDKLDEYRKKRDFRKTSEPSGGKERGLKRPIFVIQKHNASRLHYDLRLEVGGVLKSWSVPKGPSTNPSDKRLAVATEDHPLDYADFEGNIPEGEYGAGAVLVWDTGTYRNLKEKDGREVPMDRCLEEGHVTVWIEGSKLQGGYSLTRFRKDDKNQWLLVKMTDDNADARRNPVSNEPESVLTGRTIEEIASEA